MDEAQFPLVVSYSSAPQACGTSHIYREAIRQENHTRNICSCTLLASQMP